MENSFSNLIKIAIKPEIFSNNELETIIYTVGIYMEKETYIEKLLLKCI